MADVATAATPHGLRTRLAAAEARDRAKQRRASSSCPTQKRRAGSSPTSPASSSTATPTASPTVEGLRARRRRAPATSRSSCRWPRRPPSIAELRAASGSARSCPATTRSSPATRPRWRDGVLRLRARRRAARRSRSSSRSPGRAGAEIELAGADRARGGRRGRGLGALRVGRSRGRRPLQRRRRAGRRRRRQPALRLRAGALRRRAGCSRTQRAEVGRDANLDWVALGFGSARGKVRMETKLAGRGSSAKVTGAYAGDGDQHLDYDTTQEHARRGHDLRPRLPRRARRPGDRGLARDDPRRPGRPAHRRLPGEPQPAALDRGPRRRDPRPRDRGRRRPLHARRRGRPGRRRAALLPALARAVRRPRPSGWSSRASSRSWSSARTRARSARRSRERLETRLAELLA